MTSQSAPRPGPYHEAALTLWDAGWRGILPLPERAKANPPKGFTGADGAWPSYADVYAWTEGREGQGNICLRLPHHVLGIDVDDYGDKHGGATLAACSARFGPLPATWRCTSRDDGVSGIMLLDVPEHLAWPGELPGGDVELLQYRHRYAVVPPSIHPEGRRYRWTTPDGATSLTPPRADELPPLPDTWVAGLTGGHLAQETLRAGLDLDAASLWLAERAGQGQPCRAVRRATTRALGDIRTGSRHDGALRATMRLVGLARDHHHGVIGALGVVRAAWVSACAEPGRGTVRDQITMDHEWSTMLAGAVDIAAAQQISDDPTDPCSGPLHGLVQPQEAPTWPMTPSTPATGLSGSPALSWATPGAPPSPPTGDLPTPSAGDAAGDSTSPGNDNDSQLSATEVAERAILLEDAIARERARRGARKLLDDEQALHAWRKPSSWPTLTDDLAQPDEQVDYLVEEVMPVGANVLLAAQFKAGKTTLNNALIKALADNVAFLGHFLTHSDGRIAIWNYEVNEGQYRRWLRDIGIEETDRVSVLNLRGYRMPLTTTPGEEWAVDWLKSRDITFWAMDPFARAFTGTSENDNSEVGHFLHTLDVIKERAGVSELILTTHTGRAVPEQGAERSRGATRLDDWADVRWLLSADPETGERYFRATGRDVDVPEGRLEFNKLDRSLTFNAGNGRIKGGANLQATLMEAIGMYPGTSHKGLRVIVRNMLGKASNDDTDKAIKGLVSQGLVIIKPGPRNASMHYLADRETGQK